VDNESIYRDVAVISQLGATYRLTAWVRSPSGAPVNATLALFGVWGTIQNGSTSFTATSTWQKVTATYTVTASNNTAFR